MKKEEIGQAIFGSFDGMTCVLGVIAAEYIAGDIRDLILSCLALAIGEAIAMCGGSYLSEIVAVDRLKHALIIGIAACIGVILPVIPFLFMPRSIALVISALITIALGVAIAQARVAKEGAMRAYVQTFAILTAAAAASILVTLAMNSMQ